MSLYIGKINDNAILHITSSDTSLDMIKTESTLSNTVFHSSYDIAKVELIETIDGVKEHNNYNGHTEWGYAYYLSEDTRARMKVKNKLFFLVGLAPNGEYTTVVLKDATKKPSAGKMYQSYYISDTDSFSYTGIYVDSFYFANYDFRDEVVTSGRLYIYEVTTESYDSSSLKIGNSKIDFNGSNILSNNFLSTFKINDRDKLFNTNNGYDFQILNEDSNGDVILKNNSIYTKSISTGHEYKLFGTGTKGVANIISDTRYDDVSSIRITRTKQDSIFMMVGNLYGNRSSSTRIQHLVIVPGKDNFGVSGFSLSNGYEHRIGYVASTGSILNADFRYGVFSEYEENLYNVRLLEIG